VKRAFVAVVGTIAGLAVLLGYKSGPVKRARILAPAPSGPAGPVAPAGPPTTASPSAPGAPATAPPATAAPSAGGTRTVTGPDVPNQFGDVQVQLTLQGTRIVNVKAVQLPFDRQRSYEISQAAGPILAQEVIQAQNANIDLLSGATYTSESYAQSVQAALDQARA
jgi:uncharacterized protein with FMN-binding domain